MEIWVFATSNNIGKIITPLQLGFFIVKTKADKKASDDLRQSAIGFQKPYSLKRWNQRSSIGGNDIVVIIAVSVTIITIVTVY